MQLFFIVPKSSPVYVSSDDDDDDALFCICYSVLSCVDFLLGQLFLDDLPKRSLVFSLVHFQSCCFDFFQLISGS
jgi:hypothetical protein